MTGGAEDGASRKPSSEDPASSTAAPLVRGKQMIWRVAPFDGRPRPSSGTTRTSTTTPCCGTWLETWNDPTPRPSEFTVDDLREACIKAARRSRSLMAARKASVRSSEEHVRQTEEQDRKFLIVALEAYTKQNNMQPTELEFVEVKRRNLIDESGLGYLHFNFLVKGLDGKHTMFFAGVHHDLEDENDVYLCTPLGEDDLKPSKENDQALCKACQHEAKDVIHPSCGSFLGGHENIRERKWDSSDDECDYEFI